MSDSRFIEVNFDRILYRYYGQDKWETGAYYNNIFEWKPLNSTFVPAEVLAEAAKKTVS